MSFKKRILFVTTDGLFKRKMKARFERAKKKKAAALAAKQARSENSDLEPNDSP